MKKILTINCKESEINKMLNIKKINVDDVISICLIPKETMGIVGSLSQRVEIFYKNKKEKNEEIKNKN